MSSVLEHTRPVLEAMISLMVHLVLIVAMLCELFIYHASINTSSAVTRIAKTIPVAISFIHPSGLKS